MCVHPRRCCGSSTPQRGYEQRWPASCSVVLFTNGITLKHNKWWLKLHATGQPSHNSLRIPSQMKLHDFVAISKHLAVVQFTAGHVIMRQGQTATFAMIVLEGELEVRLGGR